MESPTAGSYQEATVDITDPEYVKIDADLRRIGRKVIKLVKLNNAVLKDKFENESSHLIRTRHDFHLNIQSLYHGSTAPVDAVCDEGLDQRLSRSGRFGRGIYFSDNPEKACQYAEYTTQNPYLLRCRVILGDIKRYGLGEQDLTLQREPPKPEKISGRREYYDSVMGQPHVEKPDHVEYIVYDGRRVLPDYIVFYSSPPRDSTGDPSPSSSPEMVMRSRKRTPRSGENSPRSDPSSPVFSDNGREEVVPTVKSRRKRGNNLNSSPNTETVTDRDQTSPVMRSMGASRSMSASNALCSSSFGASTSSGSASSLQPPHILAFRELMAMREKVAPAKFEELKESYHQTYGKPAECSTGNSVERITSEHHLNVENTNEPYLNLATVEDDDPVEVLMAHMISEFKAITRCPDDAKCRQYLEVSNMDLDQAIIFYTDRE